MEQIQGSCFCNTIRYAISTEQAYAFQYCHCSRCRAVTGSAMATNILIKKELFQWLAGEDQVNTFYPKDTRFFTTAFCSCCGSNLPWLSKNGTVMIVPAGGLDDDPKIRPTQQIFYDSRASWYVPAAQLEKISGKPGSS